MTRWPTLQQAQRAHKDTLEDFFHSNYIRDIQKIAKRVNAIKEAIPLTEDEAVIDTHSLFMTALLERIICAMKHIKLFDHKIAELMKILPDAELFTGLPGAGACLSARLLSAFGEQRDRFTSAQQLQQYAGIAPVTERSGKKSWVHWRWQCPKFLRQTFIEWASHSIYSSYWDNEVRYLRALKDRGSPLLD